MAKIVQPLTPEYALQRAIECLGAAVIAHAVRKSENLVYKLADPDQEYNKIRVADALLVDALCFKEHGTAPFHELFKSVTEQARADSGNVKEQMMEAQAALGAVAATLLQTLSPNSDGGEKFSAREMQGLMVTLEHLKKEIADVERAVISASIGKVQSSGDAKKG